MGDIKLRNRRLMALLVQFIMHQADCASTSQPSPSLPTIAPHEHRIGTAELPSETRHQPLERPLALTDSFAHSLPSTNSLNRCLTLDRHYSSTISPHITSIRP